MNPLTSIETTEGETNCAMLLTFAPVAPISIAVLPFAQLPFVETNNALVLLSTHAFTTGTDEVFATAKPLTVTAPMTKPTIPWQLNFSFFPSCLFSICKD